MYVFFTLSQTLALLASLSLPVPFLSLPFSAPPPCRVLILASDGLWDIASADDAARRAMEAFRLGLDPAADLVDYALAEHDLRGTVDNVTVAVVILAHPA